MNIKNKIVEMYEASLKPNANGYKVFENEQFHIMTEVFDHDNNRALYLAHDIAKNETKYYLVDGIESLETGEYEAYQIGGIEK